ncbi:hypothetical protein [Arthrobacter sp. 92]|jgi:hypothetical protein|uniref:hypothetical protein n=1 Tax=Arthrobacter sp. 92 TaxID=3418175 RepID=UPI0006A8FCC6|nr:hypothetical protein AHiyo6_18680 [Arthrobacter sp. Hiyo6]
MAASPVEDLPPLREPRDGDRIWVSYRASVDGQAVGNWLVYNAEAGTWYAVSEPGLGAR